LRTNRRIGCRSGRLVATPEQDGEVLKPSSTATTVAGPSIPKKEHSGLEEPALAIRPPEDARSAPGDRRPDRAAQDLAVPSL
jgi:hypothetical protein